jgi:DNA invertase Pin-like site-specific DNA recombinase
MERKAVILVRVSTKEQKKSGLSLIHQRQACLDFCEKNDFNVMEVFEEVGSGGLAIEDRPVLRAALALSDSEGAVLVVNKLSRLSRRVSLIASLIDVETRFMITDLGNRQVSAFEIHLLASFAEMERKAISRRTKEALAKTTKKIGNPRPKEAARRSVAVRKSKSRDFAIKMRPVIQEIRDSGISTLTGMARCLNRRGYKSIRGKVFSAGMVLNLEKRIALLDFVSDS